MFDEYDSLRSPPAGEFPSSPYGRFTSRREARLAGAEGKPMAVYHLREVGGGWAVAIVRETGQWRVERASRNDADGAIRMIPPRPISEIRFDSMNMAVQAAVQWLQQEQLL